MKIVQHKRPSSLPAIVLCSFLGATTMVDAMADTNSRMIITKPSATASSGHQHHGGHQQRGQQEAQPRARRRGAGNQLMLKNGEGAVVKFWAPDLSTKEVTLEGSRFTTPKPAVDNYHALVAERQIDDLKQAAIRYAYMRGRPSKESPSKLAAAQKTALEIEPAPIPREHHRYMANKVWEFIVRFNGKPLSGTHVALETSHGSRVDAISNDAGLVRFTIPDDFSEVKPGRRKNPAAEFSLFTEYRTASTHYETTLSAAYYVDPDHWRSKGLGVAVAGLGLIAGGFIGGIGRSNKRGKKQ